MTSMQAAHSDDVKKLNSLIKVSGGGNSMRDVRWRWRVAAAAAVAAAPTLLTAAPRVAVPSPAASAALQDVKFCMLTTQVRKRGKKKRGEGRRGRESRAEAAVSQVKLTPRHSLSLLVCRCLLAG